MYSTYQRLNLHVSASWRDVVRQSMTKIAPYHRRDPAKREARKAFYRQMLDYHEQAREMVRFW